MVLSSLPNVQRLIDLALDEDLGRGDVTTAVTVGDDRTIAVADINARKPIVVCGIDVALAVFARVDATIEATAKVADGAQVKPGDVLIALRGPAATLLAAERVALNFLQRLSGVATQARRYVDAIAGTGARVVDTRKTTPGWRALEKAAVLAGGGSNHRADLGSGVLIKDNHIVACGGVANAVKRAKATAPHPLRIEVEVTDLDELAEALDAGAEIVLLDNMTPDEAREAAARAHARGVLVEVSGGITLDTIADYARAGVDIISVGALTHSVSAVDIGLDFRSAAPAKKK